jgi:uncharacterized protein
MRISRGAAVLDPRHLFRFLRLLGIAVVAAGIWGTVIEPGLLMIREVAVDSGNWPDGRNPLRIAVISDLHVGAPSVKLDNVDEMIDGINALDPQLIVLLGDFVFPEMPWGQFVEPGLIADRLRRLEAPLGVVAVLGNHDWLYDGAKVRKALERVGIIVLENDAVSMEDATGRFWVAGVADEISRSPNPVGTVADIPADEPIILLSHDPAVFSDIPRRVALTLAGHTHGGQIHLPFVGPLTTMSRAPLRHAHGLVHEDGKTMYVTSGIGTSILPVRFNMPPEIVLITLR